MSLASRFFSPVIPSEVEGSRCSTVRQHPGIPRLRCAPLGMTICASLAKAAVLMKFSQYFGTVGSIKSDQASIPPSRLYTFAKPRCFSSRAACALRRPL